MSNYKRGYQKEIEIYNFLKETGRFHTVARTAGSHSKFDLVAFNDVEVWVFQIKRLKKKNKGYLKELNEFKKLPVPICVFKIFMVWIDRIGWIIPYNETGEDTLTRIYKENYGE